MSRRCARDGVPWPRSERDRARVLISLPILPWDALFERVNAYERRSIKYRQEEMHDSHWMVLSFLRHDVASKRRGVCSIKRGMHDPIVLEPVCGWGPPTPVGRRWWCDRQVAPRTDCWRRPE